MTQPGRALQGRQLAVEALALRRDGPAAGLFQVPGGTVHIAPLDEDAGLGQEEFRLVGLQLDGFADLGLGLLPLAFGDGVIRQEGVVVGVLLAQFAAELAELQSLFETPLGAGEHFHVAHRGAVLGVQGHGLAEGDLGFQGPAQALEHHALNVPADRRCRIDSHGQLGALQRLLLLPFVQHFHGPVAVEQGPEARFGHQGDHVAPHPAPQVGKEIGHRVLLGRHGRQRHHMALVADHVADPPPAVGVERFGVVGFQSHGMAGGHVQGRQGQAVGLPFLPDLRHGAGAAVVVDDAQPALFHGAEDAGQQGLELGAGARSGHGGPSGKGLQFRRRGQGILIGPEEGADEKSHGRSETHGKPPLPR